MGRNISDEKLDEYLKDGLRDLVSDVEEDVFTIHNCDKTDDEMTGEEMAEFLLKHWGQYVKQENIDEIKEKLKLIEEFNFDAKYAWTFLEYHPYFTKFSPTKKGKWFADYMFRGAYDFEVIDRHVFMEAGPFLVLKDFEGDILVSKSHDIALDSHGDTFDEAVVDMANKVLYYYGAYELEEDLCFADEEVFKKILEYLVSNGVDFEVPVEEIIRNRYE